MSSTLTDPDRKSAPISDRRFVRTAVLAQKLGVSTRTIQRWADCGVITRYKFNSRVSLFDLDAIERYIDSAKVSAGGAR